MAGIDRDYWLDYAKDSVSKSIESREKAADKLDSFITWLWLLYTSIFTFASLFNLLSGDTQQVILVAQPILVVIISRFFCIWVSMPSIDNDENKFADPNDVASIIDSFKVTVEAKRKRLLQAVICTIISIVSICIGLIGYNLADPNKKLKQQIQIAKLEKELRDQQPASLPKPQSLINDSIKLRNDYSEFTIQNIIKEGKLHCILNKDAHGIDSIKKFEK